MTWSVARWPTFLPALFTAVWTAFFIGAPLESAHLAVPLTTAAVLLARRSPWLPIALLGSAGTITLLAGGRYGSLDLVAGGALVLGWVGRRTSAPWIGPFAVALVALPAALRDGITIRKLLVTSLVFGSFWLFGRLVRHRALAADRAVADAVRLASADPVALARTRAEAERRHVADSAAVDLRSAVHEMVAAIDEALRADHPDVAQVRRIRERGTRTVEELRNLLVLLRAEPVTSAPPPAPRLSTLRLDLVLAAAGALVALITLWRVDGWAEERWLPLAYAGVIAALALRRTTPLVASACLTAAMVLLALRPPEDPDALLLVAAGVSAVLWVVGSGDSRHQLVPAAVVGGAAIALGMQFGTDGTAFIGAVLLVSVSSSRAWGEPDRILSRAREESDVLRTAIQRDVAAAVQRERVLIARDLHDATSHAVGVMLLQVSAAEANLATSPEKATAALRIAKDAGEQARNASSPLLPIPTEPGLDGGSLRRELVALVEQWRRCGLSVQVRFDLPALPTPELAVACYRVVQESLTNCARHAPGAEVRVLVAQHRHHLIVEIEDTGPRRAVPSTPSGGWGLSGLRERVGANHGHFTAGPVGTGFRVTARFPLPPAIRSSG